MKKTKKKAPKFGPSAEQMWIDDLKKFKKAARKIQKEFGKSKTKAKNFLIKAGILTKTGKLRKQYR